MLKNFFKFIFKPLLGKTWLQWLYKRLFFLSVKGMNFGGGSNIYDSGEGFAARYVLKKFMDKNPIVFDVGGNKGDYTKLWLGLFLKRQTADFKIYVFEPSRAAFEVLEKVFLKNFNIVLNRVALSDIEGRAELFSDFDGSGLASLARRDLAHANMELNIRQEVQTKTLDAFCREQGISRIDFLKLDVEGFELKVLQGAKNMLAARAIKFIQFEFGGTDIDTRVFFKDFYKLLNKDYRIYRILKNGLQPIQKYSEFDEIFLTTNYLAEIK